MRQILALLFALIAGPALGATYHFCDNQTGSHASTVAGDNARNSTVAQTSTTPWRTFAGMTGAGLNFETLPGGTILLFCKGGAWDAFIAEIENNTNASRASRIVFDTYDPAWGATARPIVRRTGASPFSFGAYNEAASGGAIDVDGDGTFDGHGGFTVHGFEISCVDGAGVGIRVWAPTHSVTAYNNVIHDCAEGVDSYHQAGQKNTLLIFTGNDVYDNILGWGGACTNCLIENNAFHHNGTASAFDHGIYFGCSDSECANVTIRGNRVYDNNLDVSNRCVGGNLTFRGLLRRAVIEANVVTVTTALRAGNCYGISHSSNYAVDEYHIGTIIRGNTVINAAVGIITGSVSDGHVTNNLVLDLVSSGEQGSAALTGIKVGECGGCGAGDAASTGNTVAHNTVYVENPTANTLGISISSVAGPSTVVASNLVHLATDGYCFELSTAGTAAYTAVLTNLCHSGADWSSAQASLAGFEGVAALNASANREGTIALVGTPSIASPNNANIQTTSDAKNNASTTYAPLTSIHGYLRDDPDIGAYEFGANP